MRYEEWDRYPSRLESNVDRVLEILDEEGVRGTFFVLAWAGERFPSVVERIREAGHEIATHGYAHRLIYEQTPEEFRADVARSLDVLQGITGERINGYRAPSFSITPASAWALDVLCECGLLYDSSVVPAPPRVHSRYGFVGVPRKPHEIRPGLWEYPVTTFRVMGREFPVGGGGWLRHYPLRVTRWGLRGAITEGRSALVYLHPWELDPEQPRVKAGPRRRFFHYRNLEKTASRLRALCREFSLAPMGEILCVEG